MATNNKPQKETCIDYIQTNPPKKKHGQINKVYSNPSPPLVCTFIVSWAITSINPCKMVENQFRAMEYIIIQLTLPNKTSGSVHPQTLLSLCPIFFSQCFPFQIGACWWIGHVVPIRKEILALCDFGAMCRRHLIPVPLKTTEQKRGKRRVCSESGYFSMLIFPLILAGDFVLRLMNSHFGILGSADVVVIPPQSCSQFEQPKNWSL